MFFMKNYRSVHPQKNLSLCTENISVNLSLCTTKKNLSLCTENNFPEASTNANKTSINVAKMVQKGYKRGCK